MPGRRHSALLAKLVSTRTDVSQSAIVDELRRVILDGGAPPGSPIPVGEVAEVFGVSPIPVRESLKTLTAEGLVDHQPNVGYTVARLTATELAELYLVRETLESAALAAAVANATDTDRAAIVAAHRLLEKAVNEDDPLNYHRQSRHFHIGMARPSGCCVWSTCSNQPGTSPNPSRRWSMSATRIGLLYTPTTDRCSRRSSTATQMHCSRSASTTTAGSTPWWPHCRRTPGSSLGAEGLPPPNESAVFRQFSKYISRATTVKHVGAIFPHSAKAFGNESDRKQRHDRHP